MTPNNETNTSAESILHSSSEVSAAPVPPVPASPEEPTTKPGRIEGWIAQRVGRTLVWLYKQAMKRGDAHEVRHIQAALLAGNSDPCKDGMCHLDRHLMERWVPWRWLDDWNSPEDAAYDR